MERQERRRQYDQRPEIMERRRVYRQIPKQKEKTRTYTQRPEVKKKAQIYQQINKKRLTKYRKEYNEKNPEYVTRRAEVQRSSKVRYQKLRWSLEHQIYDPLTYKENLVKLEVKKRDGFKCQYDGCGKETKLHVHHILGKAEYPEFRFLMINLITYCVEHHAECHKQQGEINITNMLLNKR